MEIERRSIGYEDAEVRAEGNSRLISGYGIVFNQESKNLGGFTERILPEAVDGLLDTSDVLALMNHDIKRGVLARCTDGKGSMRLEKDSKGVKYSFQAPNTALGDELVEGIRRGDIRQSSFSFLVDPKDTTIERRSGSVPLRTIKKFSLLADMSPVYRPAYETTSVTLRSLEEFNQSELTEEQRKLDAKAATVIAVDSKQAEEIKSDPVIDYDKYKPTKHDYKHIEEPTEEPVNLNDLALRGFPIQFKKKNDKTGDAR